MCSTYRAYLGRSWRLRASDTGQCMDQFGRLEGHGNGEAMEKRLRPDKK